MLIIKIEENGIDIEVKKIQGQSCEKRLSNMQNVIGISSNDIVEEEKTDDFYKEPNNPDSVRDILGI